MKQKLTTTEKRAAAYCQALKTSGGGPVIVDWAKSATWGHNPRIFDHHGEKTTNVSGCGYCKHSTALADCLRFLGETPEEQRAIHRKGGAGVSAVVSALAEIGWTLTPTASGKGFDAYTLTRSNA